MSTSDKKFEIPKWLKELQENSWELELLISGGAIFTLFQLSDWFISWIDSARITSHLPGIGVVLMAGMIIIKTLTLGFASHLIMRAFWLALVCVNYVFPEGINIEKIRFKKPFKINVEDKSDLRNQIVFVDRICGTIIYLTILSAFVIFGLLIGFLPILICVVFLESSNNYSFLGEVLSLILLWSFLIYFFDFLLGGLLRKIKRLSYLTFLFFTFYDYITLRFVYKNSLYLFTSSLKRRYIVLSTLLFFSVVFCFSYLSIYRIMHWPNVFDNRDYKWQMADNYQLNYSFYKNELGEGQYRSVLIPSKIIKDNFLEVFIRYEKRSDYLIERLNSPDSLRFFSDAVAVAIDDSVYTKLEWFPTWNQSIENIGISAMIPIKELENGKHILKVGCSGKVMLSDYENDEHDLCNRATAIILFWKDTE
jgi:hypothetical protein